MVYKNVKGFTFFLACSIASVQGRRLLIERVQSNGKCHGVILSSMKASGFSCMSSCDADPQWAIANIMDESDRCKLLSRNTSLPVETETAEGWSCYKRPNMDFCSTAKDPEVVFPCCVLGTSRCVPARSCLHLTTTCPSYLFESGLYWILGALNAFQMFCDMETYGGGWTRVANVNTLSGNFPNQNSYISDAITLLDGKITENYKLSTNGLRELRRFIEFTQLRVFCFKLSVNRTFHIATAKSNLGYAVVDFMTGQTSAPPPACNSFAILPDDTSLLSGRCNSWYLTAWSMPGHTSNERLYDHTAFVAGYYHILPGNRNRYECDDAGGDQRGLWMYFVR